MKRKRTHMTTKNNHNGKRKPENHKVEKTMNSVLENYDVVNKDGSKTYQTWNYGRITIKQLELIKLIDDYCETFNPTIFEFLQKKFEEKIYSQQLINDVLCIID